MSEQNSSGNAAESVEKTMQRELAHGDVIIATAPPILRHLLANVDHALFNDQVIATIRGMMMHLSREMLFTLAEGSGVNDRPAFIADLQEKLAVALLEEADFLAHAHALTIEAQYAERLSQRSGIDAVLSPLLQELAASSDETAARGAMLALAAQARFMQQQRRMELPLNELPHDLFERAMQLFREHTADHAEKAADAEKTMCDAYNPGQRRVGQFVELISAMQHRATKALEVDHAGVSIFVTALGMAAEQSRDVAIMSLGENQLARLALSLRAAGLGPSAIEEQFLYLHPDVSLPEGFASLRVDQATTILESARSEGTH